MFLRQKYTFRINLTPKPQHFRKNCLFLLSVAITMITVLYAAYLLESKLLSVEQSFRTAMKSFTSPQPKIQQTSSATSAKTKLATKTVFTKIWKTTRSPRLVAFDKLQQIAINKALQKMQRSGSKNSSKLLTTTPKPRPPQIPVNLPPIQWAYFDPRFEEIIVLVCSHFTRMLPLYCHCFDSNSTLIVRPKLGSRGKVQNRYFFHCSCDKKAKNVSKIGVSKEKDGYGLNYTEIRVMQIPRSINQSSHALAVCLAPIFGGQNYWLLLLQFVEWHRHVGAEKIFVYHQSSSNVPSRELLEFYYRTEPKFLEILTVPTKGDCSQNHYCRHEYQLQDCMFRSRYMGYRFVAPIDIDEILLPGKFGSLPMLIKSLDAPKWGSFSFRCRWILRYQSDPDARILFAKNSSLVSSTVVDNLPMYRWQTSTEFAPVGHTVKPIVKPETVDYMGVHHVHSWLDKNLHKEYEITPELGYVRHYRYKPTWPEPAYKAALEFGPLTETEVDDGLLNPVLKAMLCTVQRFRIWKNRFATSGSAKKFDPVIDLCV